MNSFKNIYIIYQKGDPYWENIARSLDLTEVRAVRTEGQDCFLLCLFIFSHFLLVLAFFRVVYEVHNLEFRTDNESKMTDTIF